MRVIFFRSHRIGSLLIRAFTWSCWSHVALVDGDRVIEAAWPRVRTTPLADAIAKYSAFAIVDLHCADEAEAIWAAKKQLGKPYDFTSVVGLAMRRNWQEEDSWFCSELVAWAFSQGGTPLFRADKIWRVTPQHLWMLAPSKDVASFQSAM